MLIIISRLMCSGNESEGGCGAHVCSVCGCGGKLHPRGSTLGLFPLFGGAQIMNAKRAPLGCGGGLAMADRQPALLLLLRFLSLSSSSSSCSGQKQKAPDGGQGDQYEKEQRLLERIQ